MGDNAEVREQKLPWKINTWYVLPAAVMGVGLGVKHYTGDSEALNTNHDSVILCHVLFPGPVTTYSKLKETFQYLTAPGTKSGLNNVCSV